MEEMDKKGASNNYHQNNRNKPITLSVSVTKAEDESAGEQEPVVDVNANTDDSDDSDDGENESGHVAGAGAAAALGAQPSKKKSSAILPPFVTAPSSAADNDGQEGPTLNVIDETLIIDPECYELELNHGRIGKMENLEPLVNIERFDILSRWRWIYLIVFVVLFADCICAGI